MRSRENMVRLLRDAAENERENYMKYNFPRHRRLFNWLNEAAERIDLDGEAIKTGNRLAAKAFQRHHFIEEKAEELLSRRDIDMPEIRAFLTDAMRESVLPAKMRPLKVFLSGPITSRLSTYREAFDEADMQLRRLGAYVPLNPAVLPLGMEPADYIRITTAMLQSADMILMLPGWEESKGAQIEKAYANYSKIPCMEYDSFVRSFLPDRTGGDEDGDQ